MRVKTNSALRVVPLTPTLSRKGRGGRKQWIWATLLCVAAASAATPAPAPLTVSQIPSIYAQKGIAPNLFLLLDDSGSMQFEYLGSNSSDNESSDYGYPVGSSLPYCSGGYYCGTYTQHIPGFDDGNRYAAQYRSAYVNPNYYDPAITYTPWACADSYPESESDTTDVASPISGFDCHWDGTVGLWVMDAADPARAYLNPSKTGAGFRDIEVWNDATDNTNGTADNGYAGVCTRYNSDGSCRSGDPTWYTASGSTPGNLAFWPATYSNYFGTMPGSNSDYQNTGNYERVQICPATATINSPNGVSSADKCTPPDALPASPSPYHTYVDGSGNYVYVESDGTEITRTPAEELQNFANWYQYYRSHILLADAGIGIAFMQLPTGFRVDYGVINTMDGNKDGAEIKSTEDFTSGYRLTFLQDLYQQQIPAQGTPNRLALQGVGNWFSETPGSSAPWGNSADEQAVAGSSPLACRANYVILATDGQWSGYSPSVGNVDDTTGPAIPATAGNAAYQYTPSNPYQDSYSDTLADVAMKYWNTDIQSGLDNDVPTNSNDAAFWQHMVTSTVGLGVTPTLVESYMAAHPGATESGAQAAVFQELIDGTASWPDASGNQIDDTWHAAVNGHGTFASASDPTALYKAISDALVSIVNRVGAASSLSVNTEKAGQTRTQTQVFQALFYPTNWWGDVLSLPLVTTQAPGSSTTVVSLSSDANWSASCVLTGGSCAQMGLTAGGQPIHTVNVQSPGSRTILSSKSGSGVAFTTTTYSAAELSAIGGASVLDYIRGDRTNEQAQGGSLRTRTSVMGDVVRSSPVFVGAPGANYPNVWVNLLNTSASPPENESGAQTYSAFVSTEKNRENVVYAGGNDGMLHAFYAPSSGTAADAGKELMGYVPAAVIPNLQDYADSTYTHHYFVNATPGVGDLFYGNSWHTWLVGGEGAGGDSIFALDITDPANFSESNPGSTVKGEWGPDNISCVNVTSCGADLGDSFGTPVITRFNNGEWGFVFGNGFNSASGVASILVGLIGSTGTVTFYELKTGYDPSDDPEGKNHPDGIAFVTAVDLNNDNTTDYVYAGDYFGNVWRFNLTSSAASDWGVGYAGGSGPMFVATNTAGTDQPITTKLLVVAVPGASGYPRVMVEFGTGADVTDLQQSPNILASGVQSLYGVWDWDFSQWNKGTPSTSVNARTPIAFQYAYLARTAGAFPLGRANLGQQSISDELTTNTVAGGTNNNRVVGQAPVCWVDASTASCTANDKYGWYMDLVSSANGYQGEKVVYNPVLRSGVFLVNTTIPTTSSGLTCENAAISGWTMALDPENGGRLPFEVFDTTGNQKFEEVTVGGETVPSSGITLGAVGSPGFVTYGGQTYLVVNTGSGEATIALTNLGTDDLAVQLSWQELR